MSRAIRWGLLCALLVGCSGCGLVLELDPPGEIDASLLAPDAGHELDADVDGSVDPTDDAGALDASLLSDAGRTSDGGDRDAGARDGGSTTCNSSRDCGSLELCERPRGLCYGPGTCVARPVACSDAEPVCGCDWAQYASRCDALAAGVNTMEAGVCPTRELEREWCALAPAAPSDDGCARCFDNADCIGSLAPICVASSCHAGGEGLCAFVPGTGDCFDSRQCRATETCVGAVIDVCPSLTGSCVAR